MSAFTLRLDASLGKKLETFCSKRGFSKNGLIQTLIRDYLSLYHNEQKSTPVPPLPPHSLGKFRGLVGMISLGGNALEDTEDLYE